MKSNGNSPPEPESTIHPAVAAGLLVFGDSMAKTGLIPSPAESFIVRQVLSLVIDKVRKDDAVRNLRTFQVVHNYLMDLIVTCKPNSKIEGRIRSLQVFLLTGEQDENIQGYRKRMDTRTKDAKKKGVID